MQRVEPKKYVEIPCPHRHPNFSCLVHGCHCEGDGIRDFPECPRPEISGEGKLKGIKSL